MEKKQPKGDLEGVSLDIQRARSVRNDGCFLGQRGIHGQAGKGEKVTWILLCCSRCPSWMWVTGKLKPTSWIRAPSSRSKFHLPDFPCVYMGTPWLVSSLLEMLQNQGKWDQMWSKLIHRGSILQHWVRNSKVNPQSCSLLLLLRCWTPGHPLIPTVPWGSPTGALNLQRLCWIPLVVLFSSSQWKPQDRMGLLLHSCAWTTPSQAKRQILVAQIWPF